MGWGWGGKRMRAPSAWKKLPFFLLGENKLKGRKIICGNDCSKVQFRTSWPTASLGFSPPLTGKNSFLTSSDLSGFVFSLWKNSVFQGTDQVLHPKAVSASFSVPEHGMEFETHFTEQSERWKVPLIFCRGSRSPGYTHKALVGAALPLQNICIPLNLHT